MTITFFNSTFSREQARHLHSWLNGKAIIEQDDVRGNNVECA